MTFEDRGKPEGEEKDAKRIGFDATRKRMEADEDLADRFEEYQLARSFTGGTALAVGEAIKKMDTLSKIEYAYSTIADGFRSRGAAPPRLRLRGEV